MDEEQNHPKKDARVGTITSFQTNKTRTNIITVGFITAMLVVLTALVIFAIADKDSDWPNALTLVVEVAVGAIIAVIVYIHSKAQNDAIQESNRRMTRVLEEEFQFATQELTLRMDYTISGLQRILSIDTTYEKSATDKDKEECLTMLRNMAQDTLSKSDVGIDLLALVRIFGKDLAIMYWNIRIQLGIIQRESLTKTYDLERTDYREFCEDCLTRCTTLRERVESP